MRRVLLLLIPCVVIACAAPRRLEDVLDPVVPPGLAPQVLLAEGERVQAELDRAAIAARQAAEASPGNAERQAAASRALFLAADLRVQRAAHAEFAREEPDEIEDVLYIEDELGDEVKEQVEPLALAGIAFADEALKLTPRHPDALLHRAMHLSLLAWSRGRARTLLEGLAPSTNRAMKAALEFPRHDGGAPLRLRGRFRTRAPWPYRDLEEAEKLLRQALEISPLPIDYLFLGDTLFEAGDFTGARDAWRATLRAEPDATTRPSIAFQRAAARRRLELLDAEQVSR